jgi:phage shock protein A
VTQDDAGVRDGAEAVQEAANGEGSGHDEEVVQPNLESLRDRIEEAREELKGMHEDDAAGREALEVRPYSVNELVSAKKIGATL